MQKDLSLQLEKLCENAHAESQRLPAPTLHPPRGRTTRLPFLRLSGRGQQGGCWESGVGVADFPLLSESAEGRPLAAGLCKPDLRPQGEDLGCTEWRQLCKRRGWYL